MVQQTVIVRVLVVEYDVFCSTLFIVPETKEVRKEIEIANKFWSAFFINTNSMLSTEMGLLHIQNPSYHYVINENLSDSPITGNSGTISTT